MKSKAALAFLALAAVAGVIAIGYQVVRPPGEEGDLELAERVDLPLRLEGRPAPPLEVRVEREEILEVFPVQTSDVGLPSPPEPVRQAVRPPRSDRDILEDVTSRWVYVSYANLAGVPIGGFHYNTPQRRGEEFEIREGEPYEGVTVYYLDSSKAGVRYGDATMRLPRIDTTEIPVEDRQLALASGRFVPDATLAWQYYWENWGKLFAQRAKNYVPAPGEHMPPTEPLGRDEIRERVDGYLEFVDEQMKVRKQHPGYQDAEFSAEEMRDRVYRQLNLDEPDTPHEEAPGGVSSGDPVED